MAYLGNAPGVSSQRTTQTFTATAGQTTFSPTSGYTLGYLDVYMNGVRLINGTDYTASNGTTVVLASGAALDDVVEVVAYIPRGLSDGYTKPEADARYMSINEETLPSQTGQSGKYLTTDGTNASWDTIDALPSQSGESGKYLTTDGSTASWATINTSPTPADVSDQANTSTGYFDLPAGTTAQRPGSPASGMVRFNTDNGEPEWYDPNSSQWLGFHRPGGLNVELLVLAGGGGGGVHQAGGGGAGGLIYYGAESPRVGTGISLTSGVSYSVTVGSGGSGSTSTGAKGGNGQDSSFGPYTAIGGGGGASSENALNIGANGGSGGGGSRGPLSTTNNFGGNGTTGQGNNGGTGGNGSGPWYKGGGGGGAGAAGSDGNTFSARADGGIGLAYSISGSSLFYAGGGGGGCNGGGSPGTHASGLGGSSVGGAGGGESGATDNAGLGGYGANASPAYRGSGGGGSAGAGGGTNIGGNGSSGIVIVRYLGSQVATGGTVTSANGYTIHTFTTSGTFTA